MENRAKYVAMIGLGFGIAVLVGLWLAIQVSSGQEFSSLLGTALVGFIPSAILAGFGANRYIQADVVSDEIPDVDVHHQRELVDLIHKRGMISVADAARILDISERDVKDSIKQLLELQIFTGYVDWNDDILYSQRTPKLE